MNTEVENRLTAILDAVEDCIDELGKRNNTSEQTLKEYEKKVRYIYEMAENAYAKLPEHATFKIQEAIRNDASFHSIKLEKVVNSCEESFKKMSDRQEASLLKMQNKQNKYALCLMSIFVSGTIFVGFCAYMYAGYMRDEIYSLKNYEVKLKTSVDTWEKNGGKASFSVCDGRVCVEVTGSEFYAENGKDKSRKYMIIKGY